LDEERRRTSLHRRLEIRDRGAVILDHVSGSRARLVPSGSAAIRLYPSYRESRTVQEASATDPSHQPRARRKKSQQSDRTISDQTPVWSAILHFSPIFHCGFLRISPPFRRLPTAYPRSLTKPTVERTLRKACKGSSSRC
jgi:hypothetical protein